MSDKKPKDLTLEELKEVFLDEDSTSEAMSEGQEPLDMDELREKIRSGEVKIVMAQSLHVQDLEEWVDKVLEAFELGGAFVTDLSMISDFGFDENDVKLAEARLGIEINERDYVYQVAQRLKDNTGE